MFLGLLGGAVSAIGSIAAGQAQSASYRAQAKAQEYQAIGQSQQGSYDSERQDERNKRLTGQQIAATASSGVDLGGTPLDVIGDARSQGELDKMAIRYGSQFRSNLSMYESKISKMNAKNASTAGAIGALSPIIGSFTGLRSSFS